MKFSRTGFKLIILKPVKKFVRDSELTFWVSLATLLSSHSKNKSIRSVLKIKDSKNEPCGTKCSILDLSPKHSLILV